MFSSTGEDARAYIRTGLKRTTLRSARAGYRIG
jgi:hypothetical protein